MELEALLPRRVSRLRAVLLLRVLCLLRRELNFIFYCGRRSQSVVHVIKVSKAVICYAVSLTMYAAMGGVNHEKQAYHR